LPALCFMASSTVRTWKFMIFQQLSVPLSICSQLQLVSSVVRYGAIHLEQHVLLYDIYVKYRSARSCWRKFRRKFFWWKSSHQTNNSQLRLTGTLIDKKQKHERPVITEKKLDDIRARLEYTLIKSLKRLAREIGVSKSGARRATQLLKLRPYKTTGIHAHLAAARFS
jgi:response regulator of citrate/malate metabolism